MKKKLIISPSRELTYNVKTGKNDERAQFSKRLFLKSSASTKLNYYWGYQAASIATYIHYL